MMRSPPLPSTPDLSTELTNTREWADGVVTGMDLVRMKGALLGKSNDAGGYPNQNNFKHSTDGVCNAQNDTDRDGMPDAQAADLNGDGILNAADLAILKSMLLD